MAKPIFQAALCNAKRIALDAVTISFPLAQEEYDHSLGLLAEQRMGDAVKQDCYVDTVTSGWPALKALEGQVVNVDELDYLAKRLDNLADDGCSEPFLAMADKLKLTDIKDLINLTFCCQQATVISDFSKLEEAGRQHYMNIHGGACSAEEWQQVNGTALAQELIKSGKGTITPYGMLYDNGMVLEALYTGKAFPAYADNVVFLTLWVGPKGDQESPAWLGLPMLPSQMVRALHRSGMTLDQDLQIKLENCLLPPEVMDILSAQRDGLLELNEMCTSIGKLTWGEQAKLRAAVKLAQPKDADQIRRLADNLDLFVFVDGVKDAAQLGSYMISQSGQFDYDPGLDDYYDFEKYGREKLERESGQFTEQGYIGYQGTVSLEELMLEAPAEVEQREEHVRRTPPSSPRQGITMEGMV